MPSPPPIRYSAYIRSLVRARSTNTEPREFTLAIAERSVIYIEICSTTGLPAGEHERARGYRFRRSSGRDHTLPVLHRLPDCNRPCELLRAPTSLRFRISLCSGMPEKFIIITFLFFSHKHSKPVIGALKRNRLRLRERASTCH